MVSPRWILLGLALAGVFVRIAYAWTLPPDRLRWHDEQEFDQIAWRLASTGRYESAPYRATPVLPWFLAAVYRVAGHSYRAARVAQSVLGGLMVLGVYVIGASLFSRAAGYVAAFGVALYPPLIYLSGVFYAEHLYTVLLVGTVVCLVKWWQTKQLWWAALAGVGLGLGALCRPVLLAFVPLAVAYVGWTASARLRWRSMGIVAALACITVGPWTVRNAMAFHHFVPVSTGFGLHVWRGNNDASRADVGDGFLLPGGDLLKQRLNEITDEANRGEAWARERRLEEALTPTLHPFDGVKADRVFESAGLEWMAYHPEAVLRLSARRLLELYAAFSGTASRNEDVTGRNQIIAAISFYPVLAAGLIGAVVAWRLQRASVVLHALIATSSLVYVLTVACTRYRLPLDLFWIVLASVTLTSRWQDLRARTAAVWNSVWQRAERPVESQWRCADDGSTRARTSL